MPGPIRRVAMISVHTSPLDQPGTGDAGGMNVYVLELARELARLDVETEIFTRASASDSPPVVQAAPGVTVRHVVAGPFEGLPKNDLPAQSCAFVRDVLRVEAASVPNRYDVIHSHYWLSGQVGSVARDRWGVPLVHTMHTTARVKNLARDDGDDPEPRWREVGEAQVVEAADRLIANTAAEARELIGLYEADPARVDVVHPGVDLARFRPRDQASVRRRLSLPVGAHVVMFVGRLQSLKGPDVMLRAVRVLLEQRPQLRSRLVVPVVGGLSGSGLDRPQALHDLVAELGIDDVVRFCPAVSQSDLADWYAAASIVCVPSRSETFGLVALEAQACGTPVIASRVGGLPTAVRHGESGVLVDGHDPAAYARAIGDLLMAPAHLAAMGRTALEHASSFGWARTARETLDVYRRSVDALWAQRIAVP
ncbi:MAG: D-inositol-3-phosphate glycosyltransferase [Actinomycetota bacterium]|nr:D-inositol-3-phosphate glycosyltransferase [Actinomycetota bacterium]